MKWFFLALALIAPSAFAQGIPAQSARLTLLEAQTALERHPLLAAAERGVQAAQRGVDVARGATGFNLNIGADGNRSQTSSSIPELNGTQFGVQFNLNVSGAILPWSGAWDGVRAAERNLELARMQQKEAQNGLTLELHARFFEALQASTDRNLAERGLGLSLEQERIARERLAVRSSTQDALLQAERATLQAKGLEQSAKRFEALARRSLFLLLSQPDAGQVLVAEPRAVVSQDVDGVLVLALQNRQDVRRAMLAVLEAEDGLLIASRERWFPVSSLLVSVGGINAQGQQTGTSAAFQINFQQGVLAGSGSYAPFSTPSGTVFTLQASISLPLIAPSLEARVGVAQTNVELARANLENAQRTAELEVRRAHLGLENAIFQIGVAERGVVISERRLLDTQIRLQNGLALPLEVEVATLGIDQAARDLVAAKVAALLAFLQLEVAMGRVL
jgi:outer membrane protein